MLDLILLYLIFNFIAGIGIAIYYYIDEFQTTYGYEIFLLLFFPAYGLGYWAYQKALREQGETEFPKEWYLWKKAAKFNYWFILFIAIIGLLALAGCGSLVGGGLLWANHQVNTIAIGAGLMYDVGSFLMLGFYAIIFFVSLAYMAAVMILIPNYFVKSIESRVYKTKYEEEKQKNSLKTDVN